MSQHTHPLVDARRIADITPADVIQFPRGIPGFEACRAFVVLAAAEQSPLQRLHAVSGPDASFLAIDPRLALPDYRCELTAQDLRRIGAERGAPLLWLALVALDDAGRLTVNLRAPIVINPATMIGQQVMPQDCVYPIQHVLLDAE